MSDDPYDSWYAISRQEIPAQLSPGVVIDQHEGTAVWIENVCGYSTGITFMTHVVTSAELMKELGLDIGPDLTGIDPDPSRFDFWITTPLRTYRNLDESLCLVSATGGRRLVTATWWVPEMPTDHLTVGYAWEAAALRNDCILDCTNWSHTMSATVRRLS